MRCNGVEGGMCGWMWVLLPFSDFSVSHTEVLLCLLQKMRVCITPLGLESGCAGRVVAQNPSCKHHATCHNLL